MEIIVYKISNSCWAIKSSGSSMAVSGRTTYKTKNEALLAAKKLYPKKEIKVEKEED